MSGAQCVGIVFCAIPIKMVANHFQRSNWVFAGLCVLLLVVVIFWEDWMSKRKRR